MNKDFYETIYRLKCITRYSNVPRISSESVAEHSFFVASIVIDLHSKYEFDLGKAISMAIVHDWAESFVDDVTVATKNMFPEIREAIHRAEEMIYEKVFSGMPCKLWKELNSQDTIESMIVKYADVLQCAQYSEHEVRLGNHGYMDEVLTSSLNRAKVLEEEIKEYERP